MLNYLSLNNFVSLLKLILDIGVVSILIYYCLRVVKNNSRTIQIVKGILFILLVNWLAQTLELKTIEFITTQFLNWGFLVVFIIFQPELRSLLEKLGKTTVFSHMATLTSDERKRLVNEIVKTCQSLSKSKTGAIISIEQTNSLNDYISTGTKMNSEVTAELLQSIFLPGTPLHDGAVIIQGDKIACASAYFPPTAKAFPSSYGARHRAAVGISEVSDCITIVVSEETGNISIAQEGQLRIVNVDELRSFLQEKMLLNKSEQDKNDEKKANQALKKADKKKNKKTDKKKPIERSEEKIIAEEIVMNPKKKAPSKKGGGNDGKE